MGKPYGSRLFWHHGTRLHGNQVLLKPGFQVARISGGQTSYISYFWYFLFAFLLFFFLFLSKKFWSNTTISLHGTLLRHVAPEVLGFLRDYVQWVYQWSIHNYHFQPNPQFEPTTHPNPIFKPPWIKPVFRNESWSVEAVSGLDNPARYSPWASEVASSLREPETEQPELDPSRTSTREEVVAEQLEQET